MTYQPISIDPNQMQGSYGQKPTGSGVGFGDIFSAIAPGAAAATYQYGSNKAGNVLGAATTGVLGGSPGYYSPYSGIGGGTYNGGAVGANGGFENAQAQLMSSVERGGLQQLSLLGLQQKVSMDAVFYQGASQVEAASSTMKNTIIRNTSAA